MFAAAVLRGDRFREGHGGTGGGNCWDGWCVACPNLAVSQSGGKKKEGCRSNAIMVLACWSMMVAVVDFGGFGIFPD